MTVEAESSGVSAGFKGCTDLISSEMSGIGVKLVLLPDESHCSSAAVFVRWGVGLVNCLVKWVEILFLLEKLLFESS